MLKLVRSSFLPSRIYASSWYYSSLLSSSFSIISLRPFLQPELDTSIISFSSTITTSSNFPRNLFRPRRSLVSTSLHAYLASASTPASVIYLCTIPHRRSYNCACRAPSDLLHSKYARSGVHTPATKAVTLHRRLPRLTSGLHLEASCSLIDLYPVN